jgi:acyl-CoA synthetase (AMP-forming)/AMP-acid ligase II
MSNWAIADVWDTVADRLPNAPAVMHGDRRRNWREFERNASGLARLLLDHGLRRGDTFAQYLYNGVEYLESIYAAFKVGLVPVNTNYRYRDDELVYCSTMRMLLQSSSTEHSRTVSPASALVCLRFAVGCGPTTEAGVSRLGSGSMPTQPRSMSERRLVPSDGRTGDDLFFLYTGGTTGLPKGVMWRQDDLFVRLWPQFDASISRRRGISTTCGAALDSPGYVHLCACPLDAWHWRCVVDECTEPRWFSSDVAVAEIRRRGTTRRGRSANKCRRWRSSATRSAGRSSTRSTRNHRDGTSRVSST